jgi:hypothetical protein
MKQSAEKKLGGRLVLSGMACLFIAMALTVVGMMMQMKHPSPGGDASLGIAKLLALAWLPPCGIGIMVRTTSDDDQTSTATRARRVDEETPSVDA